APAASTQSTPATTPAQPATTPAPTTPAPTTPAPSPAAQPAATTPAATPPAPPPPPVLGFDEAVSKAAHAVFTNAPAPDQNTAMVVIDPLVDGMTGYQTKSTQTIQDHITHIVKDDFPKYSVSSISPESLKQKPRVLVGTFTAVNAEMKTTGVREAYRFCLVMADLSTGKVIAKSVARARLADVDATPTPVFAD